MNHHKYIEHPLLNITETSDILLTTVTIRKDVKYYKSIRKHYLSVILGEAERIVIITNGPGPLGIGRKFVNLTMDELINAEEVIFSFVEYPNNKIDDDRYIAGYTVIVDNKLFHKPNTYNHPPNPVMI